jgi:hydrogenase maturation factor
VAGEDADWIGRLLIKCANNLATSGAEPVAFELTLLLPQETEEPKIRELMRQAENACEALGAQIAGGQTRVTGAVTVPTAVVTGYAKAPKGADHGAHAAAPGQDVVISKWIGLEGTAILARQYREQLLKRYPAYLVDEAADFGRYLSLQKEAAVAAESGVCAMHDASEGGIFGALWELAEGAGVGLDIDLKKLPLRQETVEVCELCGVNPYELLSGGCLVMTSFDGPGLAAALEAEQIPAAVVGKVTKGPGRILRNDGEERFMDRPKQDALYGAGADMEDIKGNAD